jgi:hypothetical protein
MVTAGDHPIALRPVTLRSTLERAPAG